MNADALAFIMGMGLGFGILIVLALRRIAAALEKIAMFSGYR